MVLRASWGSLGLLLGALGGLLGALLGLQIDRKGLTRSDPFALWALLGLSLVSFLALVSFFLLHLGLVSSKSFLILSWSLFGSILNSKDDPPTLKNQVFS